MRTVQRLALIGLMGIAVACSPATDPNDGADASTSSIDAAANPPPDADPSAPDAAPGTPDAALPVPDATPGTPDAIPTAPEITLLVSGSPLSSPPAYDFGSVWTTLSAGPITFTIRNDGDAPLQVSSIALDVSTHFSLAAPAGLTTLNPTETTTFQVTFAPGAVGAHNANVTIMSNDADEGGLQLRVTGTGAPPDTIMITSRMPGANAIDVRVDSIIEVVFDKSLAPASVNGATVTANGSTSITVTSNYNVAARTLTLTPSADLPPLSTIQVMLPNTFQGALGEVFAGDTFSFNTGTDWHDGNTIFVTASGNDGNPGTKRDPVRSVQTGFDKAVARGFTQVYVAEGSYTPSNGGLATSPTAGLYVSSPMTIRGGWNSTFTSVIGLSTMDAQGGANHVVWIDASNTTLSDFTIAGGKSDSGDTFPHSYGAGVLVHGSSAFSNILLERLTVKNNTADREGGGIAALGPSSNVTIDDSFVENNSATARGGGIRVSGVSGITVKATQIKGNSGFVGGISLQSSSNVLLEGLLVTDNTATSGSDCVEFWGGSTVTIRNNHFNGINAGLYLNGNSGTNITNLVIDNNTFSGPTGGTGTGIYEGQASINSHTITNNKFLRNYLSYIYRNSDGTQTADDAAGAVVLNTPGSTAHNATTASGNTVE